MKQCLPDLVLSYPLGNQVVNIYEINTSLLLHLLLYFKIKLLS